MGPAPRMPNRKESPSQTSTWGALTSNEAAKPPGHWLSFGLSALDRISKNVVGRTGFEPVTSSVSGKSRPVIGVCHRRTESNGEPLTCPNIPSTSRCVWGQLNTLAPICGSHCSREDAVGSLGANGEFLPELIRSRRSSATAAIVPSATFSVSLPGRSRSCSSSTISLGRFGVGGAARRVRCGPRAPGGPNREAAGAP
jgi:hypothetical protein